MKPFPIIFIFSFLLILPYSCEKNKEEWEIVNDWIWDEMNEVYFWADEIDGKLYPTDETSVERFFNSLLHEDDIYSWILDDYQEMLDVFNNESFSHGIHPVFITDPVYGWVLAVVEYVTPGSPGDIAGIRRGDMISRVNGNYMNINNCNRLFYSTLCNFRMVKLTDNGLYETDKIIQVLSQRIEESPILHNEIIKFQDHKIGYLVYTAFSEGTNNQWLDSLDQVLINFKKGGIEDLIIDLRYNPGGSVSVAQHIASSIAPLKIVESDAVLARFTWNEDNQSYFEDKEGIRSESLVLFFEKQPRVNLDLPRVYFMASKSSASASELLISGLEPYMDVIHVGNYTYGKYYGGIDIHDSEDPPRHNFAILPITFKYENSEGFTDFEAGLEPDHLMKDYLINAEPFGSFKDPVLAKTLKVITGVSPLLSESSNSSIPEYEVVSDPGKELKSTMIIPKLH